MIAGVGTKWEEKWANPYVGPRPYTRSEASKLGGREKEITHLLNLLIADRIVLLHAPSGAGKTSMVQAGLIPRLEDEEDFWVSPSMRVHLQPESPDRLGEGNRYILSLLLSLEQAKRPADQLPEDVLETLDLETYLSSHLPEQALDRDQVFIFDQFEEILTVEPFDHAGKVEFFYQVGQALRNRGRWALFIARDDYVARLESYLLPIPSQLTNTFNLDLLRAPEAQKAVRRPVEQALFKPDEGDQPATVHFEPEAAVTLVDRLRQRTPYVEPVILQVVCRRLWEDLAQNERIEDGVIDVADLEEMVDVDQALSAYYAGAVARTAERTGMNERSVRDWVEEKLINQQGVRTLVLLGADDQVIADELVSTHLLRLEERRGNVWAELAHDRLVDPVVQDNDAWRKAHLSMVQLQAELWAKRGMPDELLFTGDVLAEAQSWAKAHQGELTENELDFMAKSKRLNDFRQRQRRFFGVIAIFGVISIILAIVAFIQFGRSQENLNRAIQSNSSALAFASQEVSRRNNGLALLLALQAMQSWETSEAISMLHVAVARPGLERLTVAHDDRVNQASWNQDESLLLTASNDGTARVWDAETGDERFTLVHETEPASIVWRANWNKAETRILTASDDGTAGIWDAETGEKIHSLDHGADVRVRRATWNEDGDLIVTAAGNRAVIWDANTYEEIQSLDHDGIVIQAIWNPDASRILTASLDGTARVWDPRTGEELTRLEHDGPVRQARWNADENRIVTASEDNTARIWDAETGDEILRVDHTDTVWKADWDQAESRILTASFDGTARIWDANDGQELLTLTHGGTLRDAKWNADESQILTSSSEQTARVWDAETGREVLSLAHEETVGQVLWNQDGSQVLTTSHDGLARVWDTRTFSELPAFVHDKSVSRASWNEDESQILSTSADQTARIWDVEKSEQILSLEHNGRVLGARWNKDENQILTAGGDRAVRIWDIANEQEILFLPHDGQVNQARWNGDETRILTASNDGHARVWDLETNEVILDLPHEDRVFQARWNADETEILTAGDEGMVRVWDVDTKEVILSLPHTGAVREARWNADESQILTANDDNVAQVWDVQTRSVIHFLPHDNRVRQARWNHDESLILTAGDDGLARVWDADTGEEVFRLPGDGEIIFDAEWNGEGTQIMIATDGGQVLRYYADTKKLAQISCERIGRNMSMSEWRSYLGSEPYQCTCSDFPAHDSVLRGIDEGKIKEAEDSRCAVEENN